MKLALDSPHVNCICNYHFLIQLIVLSFLAFKIYFHYWLPYRIAHSLVSATYFLPPTHTHSFNRYLRQLFFHLTTLSNLKCMENVRVEGCRLKSFSSLIKQEHTLDFSHLLQARSISTFRRKKASMGRIGNTKHVHAKSRRWIFKAFLG